MSKNMNFLSENILKSSNEISKNIKNISELDSNKTLKEYSIKSSWASYSSTGSNYSYSSYDQLKQNVGLGVRFIHLNVYINDEIKKEPIVKGKNEQLNKDGLKLKKCLEIIKEYGFENESISSYPLLLYLELMYDDFNVDISNKISELLIANFNTKMPDVKYSYAKQNLALENIDNFKNKIIIILNYGDKEECRSDSNCLREITHAYIKEYDYLPKTKEDNNTIICLKPNSNQKQNYNMQTYNLNENDLNNNLESNSNRLILLKPFDNNTPTKRFELLNFDVASFYKKQINFIPFKFIPFTIKSDKSQYLKESIISYILSFKISDISYQPIILFQKL